MPRDKASRVIPCDRCRSLHLPCEWQTRPSPSLMPTADGPVGGSSSSSWSSSSSTSTASSSYDLAKDSCVRCQRDNQECSGPLRKSRPPCSSCKRLRARCVWTEGKPLCQRCEDHPLGLGLCPLPPRPKGRQPKSRGASRVSRLKNAPAGKSGPEDTPVTPSPAFDLEEGDDGLPLRNDAWESVLTQTMKENLTLQGQVRLNAAGFTCLPKITRGRNGDYCDPEYCVDQLAILVFSISGLKFSNIAVRGSYASETPPLSSVLLLETTRTDQWLTNPIPKSSVQENGLHALFPLAWKTAAQLVERVHPSGRDLYRMTEAMIILVQMSVRDSAGTSRARMMLAYVVMAIALGVRKQPKGDSEGQIMAAESFELIVREHHCSVALGRPSLISPAALDTIIERMEERLDLQPTPQHQQATLHCFDIRFLPLHSKILKLSRDVTYSTSAEFEDLSARAKALLNELDSFGISLVSRENRKELNQPLKLVELRVLDTCISIINKVARQLASAVSGGDGGLPGKLSTAHQMVADLSMEVLWRVVRVLKTSIRCRTLKPDGNLMVDLYPVLDASTYILNRGSDHLAPLACLLPLEGVHIIIKALNMSLFWECRAAHLIPLYQARPSFQYDDLSIQVH